MRVWKLKNGDTFKDYGPDAFLAILNEIAFKDSIDRIIDEDISISLALGNITKQEVKKERDTLRKQLQKAFGDSLSTPYSDKQKKWHHLRDAYQSAVDGNTEAATSLWFWLEDYERLLLTLHFWNEIKENRITSEVWAAILCNTWQRGKTGCLLLKAVISTVEIVEMFMAASPERLMAEDGEFETYSSLPDKVEIWRGTSNEAGHQSTGMSWTLDPIQAEWFALFRSGSPIPLLCRTVVEKKDILAAFDYENEIVVNPVKLAKAASIDIKIIPNAKIRAQQVRQMLEDRQFA